MIGGGVRVDTRLLFQLHRNNDRERWQKIERQAVQAIERERKNASMEITDIENDEYNITNKD